MAASTLAAAASSTTTISTQVAPIVEQVKLRGDAAVREYTTKFDRVELDSVCVRIEVGA